MIWHCEQFRGSDLVDRGVLLSVLSTATDVVPAHAGVSPCMRNSRGVTESDDWRAHWRARRELS